MNDSLARLAAALADRYAIERAALFSTACLGAVFDVGPDGRFLMIRRRPDLRPPTELIMLERWTDLLPR